MWEICVIENNVVIGFNYFKIKVFGLKFKKKNEKIVVYVKLVISYNYNIYVKKFEFLWVFNKFFLFLILRFLKGFIK